MIDKLICNLNSENFESMKVYRVLLPIDSYQNRECKISNINSEILEYEFLHCLTSDVLIDNDFHKYCYGFQLVDSEIFEYVTHREIWRDFLNSNEEYCLIVSSNVFLDVSYSELLNSVLSISNDFDVFFPYDVPQAKDEKNKNSKKTLNFNIREQKILEPYRLGYKWGNSIYFISRKGAEILFNINVIKDRFDNEICNLSLNNKLNVYYENVPWMKINQIDWSEWPARIQSIWNMVIELSSWTTEAKKRVRKILCIISCVAIKLKIEIILQGGSLLGFIQHGGIMYWDDDVDLGIYEESLNPFFEILKTYKDVAFGEFIEPGSQKKYFKIWFKDGESINSFEYTFPFVDIWIYNKKENDLVFLNGIICPNSALQNYIKIRFEGSIFYIPSNSLEVLDSRYAYWRNRIVIYSWSHKREKPYFPSLSIPILTNENGTMIAFSRDCCL